MKKLKKLELKKDVVAKLDHDKMSKLKGGQNLTDTCNTCPSIFTCWDSCYCELEETELCY